MTVKGVDQFKRAPRPRWTDAEIGVLVSMAGEPAADVAATLGRTVSSVWNMRYELKKGWAPVLEAWTDREVQILRETPNLSAEQVARVLGRTASAVTSKRHELAKREGFRALHNTNPNDIGRRTLLAKTCPTCGLLLGAEWFFRHPKRRQWNPECRRCMSARQPSRPHSPKMRGQIERARLARQNYTRLHAHHHGEPFTQQDDATLADPDLSILEKALQLGRTWSSIQGACSRRGFTSRIGLGDPVNGQWVITIPMRQVVSAVDVDVESA